MSNSQQIDLNKIDIDILEQVCEGHVEDQKKKQVQIANSLRKNKSQISKKLKQLDEDNFVRRSEDGHSKRISLTDKGCRFLLFNRSNASEDYNNLLHLHNFAVKFPIQNINEIEEERSGNWRERIIEKIESKSNFNPQNDSYKVYDQLYTYSINRRHVVVFIEELVGNDPHLLKKRAINKAIEGAENLEKETRIELTDQYSGIRAEVSNEHMAIMGDPLSSLIHETEYEGCDIKINDEKGQTRMWADDSDNRKDLEAGTQYGTHGFTEEDIDAILKFYRLILNNPEKVNKCVKNLQSA